MIPTEIISNISSIAECNAKGLETILSIGFDVINNYQEAYTELQTKQKLSVYFSECAKRGPFFSLTVDAADLTDLGMTLEELGVEIVKRIGMNDNAFVSKFLLGVNHSRGRCSWTSLKKLQNIFAQEAEDLTRYDKADKVFEEHENVIMFIPPDYRYPLALETMLGFVKNLRASTWEKCVDLYEEQLYRWKMLENSAENIRIQSEIRGLTKRAADSATAAAIFSGLNFVLK